MLTLNFCDMGFQIYLIYINFDLGRFFDVGLDSTLTLNQLSGHF